MRVAKLVWRVKLVAKLRPGVVTETEVACIERAANAGLAELGLRLDEAKRLTAALQAEMVPTQVAEVGEHRRACDACGRRLASKGHYGATFHSLFGAVPGRVRRLLACPCRGEGEAKSSAALALGNGAAVAPELAYVTARYAALVPFGKAGTPSTTMRRIFGQFRLAGLAWCWGGLIQAAVGFWGGLGGCLTKRSGCLAKARSRVCWRAAWMAFACP